MPRKCINGGIPLIWCRFITLHTVMIAMIFVAWSVPINDHTPKFIAFSSCRGSRVIGEHTLLVSTMMKPSWKSNLLSFNIYQCDACAKLFFGDIFVVIVIVVGEAPYTYTGFKNSLDKSLNSLFPWEILKFLCKFLKSPWIFFNFECSGLKSVCWCFLVVQDNINYSSENFKVIYIKCSMFYI